VRVIAGTYGGRRLLAPSGRSTRPTAERVREAIFAMLADIAEARVLDLYAGSGALGIEALSRGAGRAVFIERDRSATAALLANLGSLGLDRERAEVRREDVATALRRAGRAKETYDLVLIDPPYARASELGPGLADGLAGLLASDARVVVESDRRAPLQLEMGMAIEKERRYGDTTIMIHRHQPHRHQPPTTHTRTHKQAPAGRRFRS
jgi:16S rRNA (guanine966-N2)-methyltransferase